MSSNAVPRDKRGEIHYPILDFIADRWSTRAYDPDRGVSKQTIGSLLEASRWAPSAFNNQPWKFLVVAKEDQDAYVQALSTLYEANQEWVKNAPLLIFTMAAKRYKGRALSNKLRRYELGMAVMNMALQAHSLGLAFHQMLGFSPQKVKKAFGISQEYEVSTAIAVGYPGALDTVPDTKRKFEEAARTRLALEEIALFYGV